MGKDMLFGICADVHQTMDFDASDRIRSFVNEAHERNADFIIQLGDFVSADSAGEKLLEEWNSFKGSRYHVLGNHDTEANGKSEIMAFQGQEKKYYSFDSGDYHFIVLDTNYMKADNGYIDYGGDNYHKDFFNCYLPDEELAWFEADIASTDRRCFIFSHAPLVLGDWKIYNVHAFMDIVYKENQRCGFNKVTMCFAGHDHADAYEFKGGVHYMLINSISHKYISPLYQKARNANNVKKDNDVELAEIIKYKEPLYAFVRLKKNGLIQIIGKQSEYVGFSPFELHWEYFVSPQICYRELWMNGHGEL